MIFFSVFISDFISHGLEGKEDGHNINLFSLVQNSKILDPQAIKKYSTVQLSTIMGLNPEFKGEKCMHIYHADNPFIASEVHS